VRRFFAPAIAAAAGLIVLLGYFVPSLFLLRAMLVQWAALLAGAAIFVGLLNLLSVHVDKIRKKEKGSIYSLLLVVSLLVTLALGLPLGPNHTLMRALFDAVILPVETSLMAILSVTLIYASIRLLRRRSDLMAILFITTALLVMLGTAPLPFFDLPILRSLIRPLIVNIPAVAGARGILLGVALGALLAGLRVLLGTDRPYGGK